MHVISRRVGERLVIGSGPTKVTIYRLSGNRVSIAVENAASVERGETVWARIEQQEQAERDRPAE